jgi:serine/threonine protein kinase/Tfp pilus assembly protein PilF
MTNGSSGHELDVTVREFARGQKVFARYRLKKILGRGGMGIVWLARDEELEREVALKFLPDLIALDKTVISELKRETRRSLELTHKNIVRIYDFVHDESAACVSMEYIDGDTLSNLRAEKVVFQPDEIGGWIGQLCDALDYAHNHARIIHRDLKPANLMVNQKGNLKVTDFGIARSLGDTMSKLTAGNGGTGGTLVYMSPQQLEGERGSHLDDIYSLGATIYDLLTGKPPFYSGNIDRQVRERIAPSMTERRKEFNLEPAFVPPVWEETVAACLAKDPAKRPQSAAEVAQCLGLPGPQIGIATISTAKRSRRPVLVGSGIAAVLLALSGGWYLSTHWRTAVSERNKMPEEQTSTASKSIAVLPFENLSTEEENAVFAGGVQNEILTDLAKVADLKVISRTSVMQYAAGAARNLKEIARELGVSYVVEGSVQRAGERVRVTAQLIDARTDTHLWAQTYDRQLADVFAIQSEIAQKITNQLGAKLSPQERTAMASRPTQNIKAFEDYIRARALMETLPHDSAYEDNVIKATDLLDQAVARDPQFALAYSALAEARIHRAGITSQESKEDYAKAKSALQAAHRLAPEAGETHFAQALYDYYADHAYDRAIATLELAARALPNNAQIFILRGLLERRLGRWKESLRHFKRAIELDPKDPEPYANAVLGARYLRRYGEAYRIADAAIAAFPAEADIFRAKKGEIALHEGDLAAARRHLENVRRKDGSGDAFHLAFDVPLFERNYREAAKVLEELKGVKSQSDRRDLYLASLAMVPNDLETSRDELEAALARHAERLSKDPDDPWARAVAAVLNAALGNKAEAIQLARRGTELYPVSQEAQAGQLYLELLADIYAATGEKELAFELLSTLVKGPGPLGYGGLKFDPRWDSLRSDPRFDELMARAAKRVD